MLEREEIIQPEVQLVPEKVTSNPGFVTLDADGARFDLISEYRTGIQTKNKTFDEVYWKRVSESGVVYLKKMTPDGIATVITDDHGKVDVNKYDMNELVIPVPLKGGRVRDIFRPKNWKFVRNHEYLEETSLEVGRVATDGTKITEIKVVTNKDLIGIEPKGIIGDFADMLKKAGYVVEQPQKPSIPTKEKVIFGQPEEGQLGLSLETDKVPGQAELFEEKQGAVREDIESLEVPDWVKYAVNLAQKTGLGVDPEYLKELAELKKKSESYDMLIGELGAMENPFARSDNDSQLEDEVTAQEPVERINLLTSIAKDIELKIAKDSGAIDATAYFERHNGTFFVMNTNKELYRVLGRRALSRIIYDENISLEDKKMKIMQAYSKKRKSNDPEVANLILVQTTTNATR